MVVVNSVPETTACRPQSQSVQTVCAPTSYINLGSPFIIIIIIYLFLQSPIQRLFTNINNLSQSMNETVVMSALLCMLPKIEALDIQLSLRFFHQSSSKTTKVHKPHVSVMCCLLTIDSVIILWYCFVCEWSLLHAISILAHEQPLMYV